MPSVSPAQHRLMEAAAHTKGGAGGVSQAVGKEFAAKDAAPKFSASLSNPRQYIKDRLAEGASKADIKRYIETAGISNAHSGRAVLVLLGFKKPENREELALMDSTPDKLTAVADAVYALDKRLADAEGRRADAGEPDYYKELEKQKAKLTQYMERARRGEGFSTEDLSRARSLANHQKRMSEWSKARESHMENGKAK